MRPVTAMADGDGRPRRLYALPMVPLRALILDFGGVLVRHQPAEAVKRMAQLARAPAPSFTDAYWAHRDEYDLRGDVRRYWDAVLHDAGSALGGPARDEARPGLVALDAESWTQYREEVWATAERFRAAGGLTALLSNCGPEVMGRVRAERDLSRTFDATVVSWEVGCLKPDPAIYRLTLQRLGVTPAAALFVDDRAENVAAAEALGLHGFQFTGEASTAALRERLAEAERASKLGGR
jgi:putative hydrolase of the HAD superfamily